MKIGDIAKESGISAHTLRFYEKIGLLPQAPRDHSRHRAYDTAILAWLTFLNRLKATGMPLKQMIRYAHLRDQGAHTSGERCTILEIHRENVRKHIAMLNENLAVLDTKITLYKKDSIHDTITGK